MNYRFRAAKSFWRSWSILSADQQQAARKIFPIFKQDPFDPRLRTHKIHRLSAHYGRTIYAVDVAADLRAAFYVEGETVWSVSIGTHDIYKGDSKFNATGLAESRLGALESDLSTAFGRGEGFHAKSPRRQGAKTGALPCVFAPWRLCVEVFGGGAGAGLLICSNVHSVRQGNERQRNGFQAFILLPFIPLPNQQRRQRC